LIASSPTTGRRQELEARRQFVRGELDTLQEKIQQGRDDIDKKRAALEQETNARTVLDRQDEIKAIELNLTNWRQSYNDLLGSLAGSSDPNSLSVVEPAAVPTAPAGPRGLWYVLLAATGGFLIVAFGVVAIEYFNDKIRSREDLSGALRENDEGMV